MTKHIVRLGDRIMRLWIARAVRILQDNGQRVDFKNVLLQIEGFNDTWIRMGLGQQDKKDIEKTYNEMGIVEG